MTYLVVTFETETIELSDPLQGLYPVTEVREETTSVTSVTPTLAVFLRQTHRSEGNVNTMQTMRIHSEEYIACTLPH